ncbi:hypothetical protein BDM02DRAFT_3123338 [Thelephora ganbajun]|uniref:Uncharacterized protein n=1 Tax=Thelephora ganbajun TaxID=370292 RepID=A0ACB6Z2A3_THEGA|nr:hypothetical protein BDM02DRAFT_3123338 [Thelephora ganbajun]
MGIQFTPQRQEALVNGDTSGTLIHPFFVYKILSLGIHHFTILENSPPMVLLHARYIQKFWEELVNIQQGNDHDLKIQSMLFLTSGCILARLVRSAHLCLWKTCKMLHDADMRFIPKYGDPPPYSDEVHEKSTVLSQILWMENYLFLTCDGARPTLTMRIEEEFRNELPVVYPVLFLVCPLTMRTQGMLLVRDAVLLLEQLHNSEERPGDWRQSCDNLACSLDDYSDILMIHLGEFEKANDTEGASMIRSNCIACLAHLAALYRFVGEMQPSASATMDSLCDAALDNLGNLTQEMKLEEVTYFDLLLKYSWTRVIKVYDSRINSISVEEGARLWCWKQVVVEACGDFERRIPKCEPPILASLELLEDGRSEGSKYPNLMVLAVEE